MLRAHTGAPYIPVPQSATIARRSLAPVPIGSGVSAGVNQGSGVIFFHQVNTLPTHPRMSFSSYFTSKAL